MLALNFILLSLATFIGIICGSFLIIFFAFDEHVKGEKYFILMQRATIGIMAVFLIYTAIAKSLYLNILPALLLIIVAWLTYKNINSHYIYLIFPLALVFSIKDTFSLLAVSTLIFFYGIVAGTLIVREYEWKDGLVNCLMYIYYPAISILLYFLLPLFIPNL